MARIPNGPSRPADTQKSTSGSAAANRGAEQGIKTEPFGSSWDFLLVRMVFLGLSAAAGYFFSPFGLAPLPASLVGVAFGGLVILVELRLRRASLRRLIGASVGALLGIVGALLVNLILERTSIPPNTRSFLGIALVLLFTYIGVVVGAGKGDMLNLQALGGIFGNDPTSRSVTKLLDTSVIIDGRVADICETHFLDGIILVPQFVLRELQLVADSADPLKRQRGRRGLEVLQRIQKMPHLDVQIAEEDFPHIPEVDLKLVELAKRSDAKIITNDFNLNKVASVQGIDVLNVNQLANALKPVVLPGEMMRVFILREGKEYNQGVAYLDDGTMVVVDGARRLINKTMDIIVTSVHQTTAGKMIFGRVDERTESQVQIRHVSAGASETMARRASSHDGNRAEAPVRPGETAPSSARPILPDTGTE
ncbi:MAG TPA: PIN domain-containing protein [Candidatus Dormibacteraeota bacterium]|nr:PIN domain-containing protein [Candidatus Dormibacteraeota bacterium]